MLNNIKNPPLKLPRWASTKMVNFCDKTIAAPEEALDKLNAEYEALRDNLKAADRSSPSIYWNMPKIFADLKVNAKRPKPPRKWRKRMTDCGQQLKYNNQYLANECRIKVTVIDWQKNSPKNKRQGNRSVRDYKQKLYESACFVIWDFVGKKFCFKRSDQETLPQNEPVYAPWF